MQCVTIGTELNLYLFACLLWSYDLHKPKLSREHLSCIRRSGALLGRATLLP